MTDTQDSDDAVWTTESCVRGFHVYEENVYEEKWEPVNGECLYKLSFLVLLLSMALAYFLYPKHPLPHC